MIRGTTPTHTFSLPFDVGYIKTIKVLYSQRGVVVLEKKTEDFVLEGNTAKTVLTQEDTLKFANASWVDVQVRVLTVEGEALASAVEKVFSGTLLENEVLE